MRFEDNARLAFVAVALAACGGPELPRHPVGGMAARAEAKIELVGLVVSDPVRAERVRRLYRRAFEVGHGFGVARARALSEARTLAERQATSPQDGRALALERVLAPPLEVGRQAYDEYVALMLEARTLLTPDEFERLSGVR